MKNYIYLLAFFIFQNTNAQKTTTIDSLFKVSIKGTPVSSQDLRTLEKNYRVLYYKGILFDSTSVKLFHKKAIQLCHKTGNAEYESIFNSYLALTCLRRNNINDFSEAKQYIKRAIFLAKTNRAKGRAWFAIGKLYRKMNKNEKSKALTYYLEAEKLLTEAGEDFMLINIYFDRYEIYTELDLTQKQMEQAKKAVQIALEDKNTELLHKITAYYTLANSYLWKYDEDNNKYKQYLDSSIQYYKLVTSYDNSDIAHHASVIRESYYNLATIYSGENIRHNVDIALFYLKKMEALPSPSQEIHQGNFGLYQILKADLLIKKNRLPQAAKLLDTVSLMYDQNVNSNFYVARYFYNIKALLAKRQGNLSAAIDIKEKEMEMADSLYNIEKVEAVQATETKFKNYKQEQDLLVSKKENSAQKKLSILYLFLAILGAIGILFVYQYYRARQKTLVQQQQLSQSKQQEALLKAKINEDEALNALNEKDLALQEKQIALQEKLLTQQQRDGLQQALLYNHLQIERKTDLIKSLQQHITEINAKQAIQDKRIDRLVEHSVEIDEELDFIQKELLDSNPSFFTILQNQSQQLLSNLDIKYCAYIKMGMSNREIAQMLNIEQKSVRMAKYRLKQKLQLSKIDELDTFLYNLQ